MSNLTERIKLLATGKAEWCDAVTGEVVDNETLDWSTRWAIAGPHSYQWKWVHRFGAQECGCVKNPLTRRMVLFCSRHSAIGCHCDCSCGS